MCYHLTFTFLFIAATFVTDRSHGAAVTGDDGNPLYMAPKLKVEDAQVSDKVDIFSLGLVFCDLLYQFITDSERAKMSEILRKAMSYQMVGMHHAP